MNVDEALRRFAEDDRLPREAMAWALENWRTASPRFIARLRAIAAGDDRTDGAEGQLFTILHLCGQMRETRAYEPLCRLIAEDPDLEVWLGDAVTETLPGILINVFDGDVAPLLSAIEVGRRRRTCPRLDAARAWLRGSVARRARRRGDARMSASIAAGSRPREMPGFWSCWAETAAALGYEDLKMEVAVLTKDGLLDAIDFGLEDFDRIVELARGDPSGFAGFHNQDIRPLDDAIGTLNSWIGDVDEDDMFESDENEDVTGRIVRALPASIPSVMWAATTRVPAEAARNTKSAASPPDRSRGGRG